MGGRIVQLVHGEKLELAFDDFDYWISPFRSLSAGAADRSRCGDAPGRQSGPYRADIAATSMPGGRRNRDHREGRRGLARRREKSDRRIGVVPRQCVAGLELRPTWSILILRPRSARRWAASESYAASTPSREESRSRAGESRCASLRRRRSPNWNHSAARSSIPISIRRERCRGFRSRLLERLRQLTRRQLIVAGGIREMAEIEALDHIGVDAVAGMAVYTGTCRFESHGSASPRLLHREIQPGSKEASRDKGGNQRLPKIMPAKCKAGVDHPKNCEAEPDRCGAHFHEHSTRRPKRASPCASFASIPCGNVDFRLPVAFETIGKRMRTRSLGENGNGRS